METATGPQLEYVYDNDKLIAVKVKDQNGVVIRHCILSYNSSGQLVQVDWDIADGNVGFYLEQTIKFSYYPNGNVMEMITHDYPVGSQTETTYADKFENYDSHPNADGFALWHTNPHELVLIPQTKIQLNNPQRNIHTGDGINYDVQYSYTYDAKGRPIIKTGDLEITNGTNAGQHVQIQYTFSYYD